MDMLDCIKSGEHLKSCDNDGFCNECGFQDEGFFYEIHVIGKNSFSTSIVSDTELDDNDIIMKAYEEDKLEGDDCHYIDYIEPLEFDVWNEHFNFNK